MVLTPGSLFFTHVAHWPEGVQGGDLTALAALTLEDVSPFALESLAWGFCCDEASRTLFLYAACLPRISPQEQEQWVGALHVFPSFLPLLAERGEGTAATATLPQYELLLAGSEVLLIERASGSRWPRRVRSELISLPADAPAAVSAGAEPEGEAPAPDAAGAEALLREAALAAAWRLLRQAGAASLPQSTQSTAGASLPAGVPFWQCETISPDKRGAVRFALRAFGGSAEQAPVTAAPLAASAAKGGSGATLVTRLASEEACWLADLRSEPFIADLRKRRKADLRLWYVLGGAVLAAAVLVLLWLSFWGLGLLLERRSGVLAAQSTAVERVRSDQDLLTRMRQFSAEPFAPFSLIRALSDGKPPAIYFDAIELSGPDSVTVEGQGPTVDAVNAYVRTLEQSGRFKQVRQARMNLKDGVSVFTLYLQYEKPLAGQSSAGGAAGSAQEGAGAASGSAAGVSAAAAAGAAGSGAGLSASGNGDAGAAELGELIDLTDMSPADGAPAAPAAGVSAASAQRAAPAGGAVIVGGASARRMQDVNNLPAAPPVPLAPDPDEDPDL